MTLSRALGRRPRGMRIATLVAGLAAGCGPGARDRSQAPQEPPANVLLVTIDTLRADRVGAFGGQTGVTPRLDRLATEGLRCEAGWAPAPLTLPSHASLMTGLSPPRHGLRENGAGRLPPELPTLAELLAAGGRRTGAFVGAFVLDRRFGLDRGFERYNDEIPKSPGSRTGIDAERRGRIVVDAALEWLSSLDGAPFFLWVHLFDPHAPYDPPEPSRSRFPGAPYDGEVAEADAQLGRLLDALGRTDPERRTLVVVAADHGEALGAHGEPTHGLLLYEPTLHVPIVLRGAGLAAGGRVAAPVGLVDLGPTIAGLVGARWPDRGGPPDGRDLSADLVAGREPEVSDLYAETEYPRLFGWAPLAAVRRGDWKYIEAPRPELYDLAADPAESRDRIDLERRLAAALRAEGERVRAGAGSAVSALDDAEARKRLAALGYLSGSVPSGAGSGRDPKDVVGLFARLEVARQELEAGRLERASTELERLVAEDPANPVFLGTLAEARRRRGDGAGAIREASRALTAAPADAPGWFRLARSLEAAGRREAAEGAFREALRRDPQSAEGWNSLGVLLARSGRLGLALEALERAGALDPAHATVANNRGNVLRDLERLEEAENAYRRALELAPAYADPWNGLGVVALARGSARDALSRFDRALLLAPKQHEVRLNRAVAFSMLGERDGAIAELRAFLAATKGDDRYTAQRQSAGELLAELGAGRGSGPPERR